MVHVYEPEDCDHCILVGENARDNDDARRHRCAQHDLWFHIDGDNSSPHVFVVSKQQMSSGADSEGSSKKQKKTKASKSAVGGAKLSAADQDRVALAMWLHSTSKQRKALQGGAGIVYAQCKNVRHAKDGPDGRVEIVGPSQRIKAQLLRTADVDDDLADALDEMKACHRLLS